MRQVVGDVPLGGSPFPPIADYAFLSDCEACALDRAERQRRVAVPATLRLAVDLRLRARPRRGAVPARPGGHHRPRRPPLPARHDGHGDHVGHAHGLGDRPRRPPDRPVAPHGGPFAHPPALADRHRRRPRPPAHDALRQRLRRDAHGVRAQAGLRPQARRLGVRRGRLQLGRRDDRGRRPDACTSRPTCGSASRAAAPARARPCATATRRSSRCRGPSTRRRARTTRPTTASSSPPTTGTSGCRAATFPTTRGRRTWRAAPSR